MTVKHKNTKTATTKTKKQTNMKLLWLNLLSSIILISLLNVQGQLLKNNSITRQPSSSETGVANLPILKRGKRYLDFTKGTRMSVSFNELFDL